MTELEHDSTTARPAAGDDRATPEESARATPPDQRRLRSSRLLVWGGASLLTLVAIIGWFTWKQVQPLVESAAPAAIAYTVPDAPRLSATTGETVYRIDPTQSALTYSVDEKIVGQTASTAEGSTSGIAGDLAVDASDPSATRVGQVVVNVEQLHSDNNLRDNRIRDDFLESEQFPLAQFDATGLDGLPATLVEGQAVAFTMNGTLSAHGTSTPVQWTVDANVESDRVTATAETTVKMSSLGVGPISLAGLVTTSDDVTLTMDLVALDPSKHTIPTEISPPPGTESTGDSPSFETAVSPLLSEHCASCHAPGEVGAAHWELSTAADAAEISDGIATVTASGYMPPWPASDLGVPLAHSKTLSQANIDTLVQWGRSGGVLDVSGDTPVPVGADPSTIDVRHDLTLPMTEAYTGSLDHNNDYRCFVLDPGFVAPTYVTGYEVTPGVREEIHHAQLFQADAHGTTDGLQKSGADGKPGWSCYGGTGVSASTATSPGGGGKAGQKGLIGGWVPGQDPTVYPESSGILFEPGDAVILQVHYHYEGQATADVTTVALQTEPITTAIVPLHVINPLGPVEIPCLPGDTAPLCDRNASIANLNDLYGGTGGFVEEGLLKLCGTTADELTADFTGIARTTCRYKVPESGRIVTTMGHMHTLGQTFRLTVNPGQQSETILLDIPQWNFDWQMNYLLAEPLHVKAGDTIEMTCSWDRSIDPNRPPRYIVFAEGTEDEMCFSTYGIIPDAP